MLASARGRLWLCVSLIIVVLMAVNYFWQSSTPRSEPIELSDSRVRTSSIDQSTLTNNSTSENPSGSLSEADVVNQLVADAAVPRTRAELISQTASSSKFSNLLFDQAKPAGLNAAGELVLESSLKQAAAISRSLISDKNVSIRLAYPGLTSEMDAPIVYLISPEMGQSLLEVVPSQDAVLISAGQIPQLDGNYFFNIEHYNPLNLRRQRYLFTIHE